MLYNDDGGFVGTPYPLYSRLPFFRLTCGGWGGEETKASWALQAAPSAPPPAGLAAAGTGWSAFPQPGGQRFPVGALSAECEGLRAAHSAELARLAGAAEAARLEREGEAAARSEARLQEALVRLLHGRTSFIVAHRLSTIRHAHLVLVLDQGRIIERGTHPELVRAGGTYAALYRQFVQVDDAE